MLRHAMHDKDKTAAELFEELPEWFQEFIKETEQEPEDIIKEEE